MLLVIGLEGVPLIVPNAPQLKFINPEVIDHNVPVNISYASSIYLRLLLVIMLLDHTQATEKK